MRKLLVNADGVIENIIVVGETYVPPKNFTIVDELLGAAIGDRIVDGALVKTIVPEIFAPITPRQIRLALLSAGLLDSIDTAIAAIPDEEARKAAQIEWDYALQYERSNPTLIALGTALGLDDTAIDDLWRSASNL